MSGKAHPPELKKYMDKRLQLKLNAGRTVSGVLRGFDPYMNIVMDEAIEERSSTQKYRLGMVVRVLDTWMKGKTDDPSWRDVVSALMKMGEHSIPSSCVIRGNSIVLLEALERIV